MFNIKSIISPVNSSNLSFKSEKLLSQSDANFVKRSKKMRVPLVPNVHTISLPNIHPKSSQNSLFSNSFTILSKKKSSKDSQSVLPPINQNLNKNIQSIIKNYPSIYLRRQNQHTFPKIRTNYLNNLNIKKKAIFKNESSNKFQYDSIYYGDLSRDFK